MGKSYGQLKAEYIQWRERKEAREMEAQAKIDIERLKREESESHNEPNTTVRLDPVLRGN